jgi:hypothetical protein
VGAAVRGAPSRHRSALVDREPAMAIVARIFGHDPLSLDGQVPREAAGEHFTTLTARFSRAT